MRQSVTVKVRLQGFEDEVAEVRKILLERCPELILGKPRKGTNPKYADKQKWASYGDLTTHTVRRRRSD